MKRSTFKKPTPEQLHAKLALKREKALKQARQPKLTKNTGKRQNLPKKRHKKTELKKLKDTLWKLCREIQIKRYGNQCYTCPNKPTGSGLHLGHFIPSSVCSTEVRYLLENLRPQCYRCNIHLSGNWIAFESHLIADGVDVQELKDRNEKTKGLSYREDWYEAKVKEYEALLNSL